MPFTGFFRNFLLFTTSFVSGGYGRKATMEPFFLAKNRQAITIVAAFSGFDEAGFVVVPEDQHF